MGRCSPRASTNKLQDFTVFLGCCYWTRLLGDHLHFFPAIDRRDLESERVARPEPQGIHPHFRRPLTTGELACVMSHVAALERWLPYIGLEGIIIMEDDVTPTAHAATLPTLLEETREENPDLDTILLCVPWNPYGKSARTETADVVSKPYPYGTTMVWRDKWAADRFINRMKAYNTPANYWAPDCGAGKLGLMRKHTCIHSGADTYIGNQYRGPSSIRHYRE